MKTVKQIFIQRRIHVNNGIPDNTQGVRYEKIRDFLIVSV